MRYSVLVVPARISLGDHQDKSGKHRQVSHSFCSLNQREGGQVTEAYDDAGVF